MCFAFQHKTVTRSQAVARIADRTASQHLRGSRDAIGSVLRPLQHSIGYMGDGFYRSKDPTNSIKVLKEKLQWIKTQTTQKT